MLRKHWQTFLLLGIALGLFLIPNLLWGNLYILGGDDSRLYYLYPLEYLKNFSFKVISNNTLGGNLGYFPVSFSAPTVVFLYLLKLFLPFANTQLLAYGAILAFGFVFFYKLLRELVPGKSPWHFFSAIAASLFYILSPYITRTFYQHQIISIFLLMVVPGSLYFFVAGLKRKRMALVVASALLYSVFSSTVFSLPWFLPAVFVLIPFFLLLLRQHGIFLWKSIGVFVGVTVLCNFYWMIHMIIPVIFRSGEVPLTSSLASPSFKMQNADLIYALSFLNTPTSQMVNYLRTSWDARQGIGIAESFGAVYVLVVLFAGALLVKVKKETRTLFIVSVFVLLLAMMFVTPNFGQWNIAAFQFFNAHIPFFGMFRNMYDKFALAMAFGYAFAFFMALIVIGEAKIRYRWLIPGVAVLFALWAASPYIRPSYNDEQYSMRVSGSMNKEFVELMDYVRNMDTSSRFLWLPMTFPGYVYIADEENTNHYYVGLSPMQLLSQKSDIAGFYGIQTASNPELNWKILELLRSESHSEIAGILAGQNIGYIILNNEVLPQEGRTTLNGFEFMDLQTDEFFEAILGEKIRDFGSRYSLHTINDKYYLPTVSGADSFRKLPDGSYEVVVGNAPVELVLREPYNRFWKIDDFAPPMPTDDGFGNQWQIDRPGTYRIEFWPRRFSL